MNLEELIVDAFVDRGAALSQVHMFASTLDEQRRLARSDAKTVLEVIRSTLDENPHKIKELGGQPIGRCCLSAEHEHVCKCEHVDAWPDGAAGECCVTTFIIGAKK